MVDPGLHRADLGDERAQRGPVGIVEVEAGVTRGEIDLRQGLHQRSDAPFESRVAGDQFTAEFAQIVGLLKLPTLPEQIGLEDLFEHFGELALAKLKAEFLLRHRLEREEIASGDPEPVLGIVRVSLP